MVEFVWVDSVSGEDLFRLFERHRLLSGLMRIRPDVFNTLATVCRVGAFHLEGKPFAWMVESPIGEPGVLDLSIVSEGKDVPFTREDLATVRDYLYSHWFDQIGAIRVQAMPPISRKKSVRLLRFLGFREETKVAGIRNGINLGRRFEPLTLMGLLPEDVFRVKQPEGEACGIA